MQSTDLTPVLPSIQTLLCIFLPEHFVFVYGTEIEFFLKIAFLMLVNVYIFTPLGQSMKSRLLLFAIFDISMFLAFIHTISWDWSYSSQEILAATNEKRTFNHLGGDEQNDREKLVDEIDGIYFWTKDEGEASALRTEMLNEIPIHFAEYDRQMADIGTRYQDGTIGWWEYRHEIDTLNSELPPRLAEYVYITPRAETLYAYATVIIGLVFISLPLQKLFLGLCISPWRGCKTFGLARKLMHYNRVVSKDGKMSGSFTYHSPYLTVKDVRLNLANGEWNPEREGELFLPTGTILRFEKVQKRSIFEQD